MDPDGFGWCPTLAALNPPPSTESGGVGAGFGFGVGAVLTVAVLARGMLKAITLQPLPRVPAWALRLARGGSV